MSFTLSLTTLKKNRKYDIYVLTVLLIIVAAGFLLRPQSKSNMIKITLNKEVYGYYDLNKNQTIHINKENTLKETTGNSGYFVLGAAGIASI